MKSRYVKKLRLKISNFKPYKVYETIFLFGDIDTENDIIKATIYADSFDLAMGRFINWYRRKYKKRHHLDGFKNYLNNSRTTSQWGKVAIKRVKDGMVEFYG